MTSPDVTLKLWITGNCKNDKYAFISMPVKKLKVTFLANRHLTVPSISSNLSPSQLQLTKLNRPDRRPIDFLSRTLRHFCPFCPSVDHSVSLSLQSPLKVVKPARTVWTEREGGLVTVSGSFGSSIWRHKGGLPLWRRRCGITGVKSWFRFISNGRKCWICDKANS